MNWHAILGIGAGVLQVSSIIPYIRDIIRGDARPNIVSFALWTTIQVIAIAAQISAGASWSLALLFATTFNTTLVVILCLRGYGYKKYGLVDKACLGLAVLTLVLWQITNNAVLALVLAVVTDLIASLPTIVKTYKDPFSETVLPWFMIVIAAAMGAASTTIFNVANLIYPLYMFAMNSTITGLTFFGRQRSVRD